MPTNGQPFWPASIGSFGSAGCLRYRNLLAVEDTFKTKALLTTRPIFHKTDAAIRGHIFCSFLAVLLRKELFDRLAARRHGNIEWQHIVDDLDELV